MSWPLHDYPEPADAKEVCCYCGRKTRDQSTPITIDHPDEEAYTVVYKVHCARIACLDAALDDPDYIARFPAGQRAS